MTAQPSHVYAVIIWDGRNMSLLEETAERPLNSNTWHANAHAREEPITQRMRSQRTFLITKKGLSPHDNVGNSESAACCRTRKLNKPTY